MRHSILVAVIVIFTMSFGFARANEPQHRQHEQLTIEVDRPSPTIDISSYTLITNNAERDRREATELMRVKADLPRAVQTKDKALFESILARDFTFRGENQWYERDAYIQARVESRARVVNLDAFSPDSCSSKGRHGIVMAGNAIRFFAEPGSRVEETCHTLAQRCS